MSSIITCLTLVDITETGVTKGQSHSRDQQRNWESVLQMLGLKTQPVIIKSPVMFAAEDMTHFEFGEFYEGYQNVWAFQFTGERTDFTDVKQLEEDFNEIPITMGLDETARFMLPIFLTSGLLKNIYFLDHQGLNIT